MDKVITIGIDISKLIFQVHGVDGCGAVVLRKKLRRQDFLSFFARQAPVLIGMEACGGALHWARELIKLGHEVKLMPAAYVKPDAK